MSNRGIDYGMGKTNIDTKTGIRFGVVSQNTVGQAWYDASEPYYGAPDCAQCAACGAEFSTDCAWGDAETCPECDETFEVELPDFAEPISYTYFEEGYSCEANESGDIFVTKSPYFTYAQFCSPCAPGACHLESPLDEPVEANKCYCFGHDWFEDGAAPYPVYSVETGQPVEPE